MLSDPRKRSEYDRRGPGAVAVTPEDLFRGVDLEDLLGGLGLDIGPGFFDAFFARRRGPRRGADREVIVEVALERVLTGGPERVRVSRAETCAACGGSGARRGTAPRACAGCGGTGSHVTSRRDAGVSVQRVTTCPACGGRGQVIDEPCPDCRGRGEVERGEELTVQIPAGAEDGMALRIPGRGMPSPDPAGKPGDLLVVVRTRLDPRFERDGADLWRVETIPVTDAVLGTSLEVPTLEGPATVTVPEGTQPETVLRLRGKGLPDLGGTRRGELYVRLRMAVPERLSREERRLWEQLRDKGARARTPRRGRAHGGDRT